MSNSLENLPPEMQERIRNIVAQGQAPVTAQPGPPPQPQAPVAPPVRQQVSLMDHLVALRRETAAMRQEVAAMRQEVANGAATIQANSEVVEAVGQAVGTIYQMFQSTPNQGSTYSQEFQQSQQPDTDY